MAVLGHVLVIMLVTLGTVTGQSAYCPFTDLVGDIGQYPTNFIDQIAKFIKPKELIKKWGTPKFSKPSFCTPKQYQAIAQEVIKVVNAGNPPPATVLRMAFHTCGTWSQSAQNGGCGGGWHRFEEDRRFPGNSGIEPALDAMKPIKAKFPCITWSDLYTFAGVVAQEQSGGPATAWHPGRLDAEAPGPAVPPFSARLPDGMFNAAGVQYNFLNYGLTMRETVALIGGGHSIGGADPTMTGWNGTFTKAGDNWPTPKNDYFTDLVHLGWVPQFVKTTGRLQFVKAPGQKTTYTNKDGQQIIRLPSDIALRENPHFSFWVTAYALNVTLFLEDYTRVLQRTLQFGAGITYQLDPKYTWKGLKGTAKDYGINMHPQLDTVNVPKVPNSKAIAAALVDPSKSEVVNIPANLQTGGKPVAPLPVPNKTPSRGFTALPVSGRRLSK